MLVFYLAAVVVGLVAGYALNVLDFQVQAGGATYVLSAGLVVLAVYANHAHVRVVELSSRLAQLQAALERLEQARQAESENPAPVAGS